MKKNLFILFCLSLYLGACSSSKKIKQIDETVQTSPVASSFNNVTNQTNTVQPNQALKEKYGMLLNVSPDSIVTIKLYTFIDDWLNTPYKWGGTDKNGIDCSALIQRLLEEVYNLKIPRTSMQQLLTNRVEPFRSAKYLSEGDILFFRTMENKVVSHVGIYLQNHRFIHSSPSKGVSIASLKDHHWKQRFVVAGRVKVLFARN